MLALLVYVVLVALANAGMLVVAARMVEEAPRPPTPAENARRYTQEDGTW